MSNLKQALSDKEIADIEQKIKKEKQLGKPQCPFISLHVERMPLHQLIELRDTLKKFYHSFDLTSLHKWISYKQKCEKL